MDMREEYRKRLSNKPKALALLDELFINPFLSVSRAQGILEVSNPTARQAVEVFAGMLEEVTGRSWGRLYLARPTRRNTRW